MIAPTIGVSTEAKKHAKMGWNKRKLNAVQGGKGSLGSETPSLATSLDFGRAKRVKKASNGFETVLYATT